MVKWSIAKKIYDLIGGTGVNVASINTASALNVLDPCKGTQTNDINVAVTSISTALALNVLDPCAGTQTNDINVNLASAAISTAVPIPVNVINPFLGGAQTTNVKVDLAGTSLGIVNVENIEHGFENLTTYKSVINATMTTVYDSATIYPAMLLINGGANPVYFALNANATTASQYLNNGEHIMLPVRHTKFTMICATGGTAAVRLFSFAN